MPFGVVVADRGSTGNTPRVSRGLGGAKASLPVRGRESTFGVRLPPRRSWPPRGPELRPIRGQGTEPPRERAAPLYRAKEPIGSLPQRARQTPSSREGSKGTSSKQMVALRSQRATGSPPKSADHERLLTAAEGWLIAERGQPSGQPSGQSGGGGSSGLRGAQVLLRLAGGVRFARAYGGRGP